MTVKCIDKEFDLTVGKEYKVSMLESQGDIYRIVDDSGKENGYSAESFAVVKKGDELMVKCVKSPNIDLIVGKVYEVLSVDTDPAGRKSLRVIDESGEDYLYGSTFFEVVK